MTDLHSVPGTGKDPYSIDLPLVRHIAKLAALDLDPSEETLFVKELNQVLGHMKQLKSLNTDDLQATFQTFPLTNVTRSDETAPSLSLEQVLLNAPERDGSFFKAPSILETGP